MAYSGRCEWPRTQETVSRQWLVGKKNKKHGIVNSWLVVITLTRKWQWFRRITWISFKFVKCLAKLYSSIFFKRKTKQKQTYTLKFRLNCIRILQWASYQIRKIVGCACAGNARTFSTTSRVGDPDMHHSTYVTHVPWYMPGSLTGGFLWSQWRGKRSWHSRRMRNLQFNASGKRPIANYYPIEWIYSFRTYITWKFEIPVSFFVIVSKSTKFVVWYIDTYHTIQMNPL